MIFYHIQVKAHYQIQVNADVGYVKRLISYIYHPENFYFVSVDSGVPAERSAVLDDLQLLPNIAVAQNVTTTWGGISTVNSILLGIARFAESAPHLRYFINLSGVDFPTKSQSELFEMLASSEGGTPAIWMASYAHSPEYFVENATASNSYRLVTLRPGVELLVDTRIAWLVQDPNENAMRRPLRRAGFMVHEVAGEGLLIARPLLDVEHRARLALFNATGYWVGRTCLVANREFCNAALGSERFFEACQIVAGTLLPEEAMFQTAVPTLPQPIVHHKRNFHFKGGDMVRLHDGILGELEATDRFFARELDTANSRGLMDWADRRFAASRAMFDRARGTAAAGGRREEPPPAPSRPVARLPERTAPPRPAAANPPGTGLASAAVAGAPRLQPHPHLHVPLDHAEAVRPRPADYKYRAVENVFTANLPVIEATLAAIEPLMLDPKLSKVENDKQNETDPYWNNGFFSGSDARSAYAFAASLKPRKIVEIGSGNSTKFFRKSINDHQLATRLTCIDPYPRADISRVADEILPISVLDAADEIFVEMEKNDILFIDGSHLCVAGTDTVHYFLNILPVLRSGVLVHIHDVTLPYEYPDVFKNRYYAEQYVLATCLIGSRLLQPVLPVHWLAQQRILAGDGGVSFWCRRL